MRDSDISLGRGRIQRPGRKALDIYSITRLASAGLVIPIRHPYTCVDVTVNATASNFTYQLPGTANDSLTEWEWRLLPIGKKLEFVALQNLTFTAIGDHDQLRLELSVSRNT